MNSREGRDETTALRQIVKPHNRKVIWNLSPRFPSSPEYAGNLLVTGNHQGRQLRVTFKKRYRFPSHLGTGISRLYHPGGRRDNSDFSQAVLPGLKAFLMVGSTQRMAHIADISMPQFNEVFHSGERT